LARVRASELVEFLGRQARISVHIDLPYRSIEDAREANNGNVPAEAVLADRPIYKGGQILRPWQKRFVQTCVDDYRLHGKARYLISASSAQRTRLVKG
jgi:hypothetical protein